VSSLLPSLIEPCFVSRSSVMDDVAGGYSPGRLARLSTLLGAPEAALRLLVSILLGKYSTLDIIIY